MKILPVGIQSFARIQRENYVYVDKTKYIYDLTDIKQGRYFFLSRPRRFGKSLLISTLKELFSGNKELFNGLWISTTDYNWQKHPVIHLDFSTISGSSVEEFKLNFGLELDHIGLSLDTNVSDLPTIGSKFKKIVQSAHDNGLVLLIDEYDRPLLHQMHNVNDMHKIQHVLSDFYALIKGLGDKITFLFLTGVTKFSKTSVFSGMNNLIDLTYSPRTAELLGYTEHEVTTYFQPFIQEIAQEQNISIKTVNTEIKHWYNGYRFCENSQKIYNPFSLMMYLQTKRLRNYWFESGTPTFLVNLIKQKKYPIENFEHIEIDADSLSSFDIDNIKLVPLLLQTGYLTIKSYDSLSHTYVLRYPNEETKNSFLLNFMETITQIDSGITRNKTLHLIKALNTNNLKLFFEILTIFFATIPYDTQIAREQYYQSIFYVILSLLGAYTCVEVTTNNGRIDCTVTTQTHIYLFEFKLNGTPEEALAQIEEKKYYQKYLHDGKKITLIGVAFDTKLRNISKWSFKEYA